VKVTDADRVYRNYTQETATVDEGHVRVEVRGLTLQDENNTRLNLLGFPERGVERVSGGIVELVGSYGFAKNAEVGFIVPGFFQSLHFRNGGERNEEDVGDLQLYGKFQRAVAEHCNAGAGLQLSMPNGPEEKGFGTGELGLTPYVSTRYQQGRLGVGVNVGWTFYAGEPPDVFNYGAEVILRGTDTYAIRTEIVGRVFDDNHRFHDLTILPGLDIKWSDTVTLRPTGMANGTDTALDWGLGAGVAVSF
jgi:hypothetical protein